MGLLDDAIREHLDLKRRRGADPAEVARMEHEALGPVRREPVPADDAHADDARGANAPDARGEPHAHEAPRDDEQHDQDPQPVERHERPHAPAPDERHDPPHGDPLFEHRDDPVIQPTTEYRVEDHHGDENEDEPPARKPDPHASADPDDDVLEETPDFLQETPEHDRLWFEQRPPRDFDFDG